MYLSILSPFASVHDLSEFFLRAVRLALMLRVTTWPIWLNTRAQAPNQERARVNGRVDSGVVVKNHRRSQFHWPGRVKLGTYRTCTCHGQCVRLLSMWCVSSVFCSEWSRQQQGNLRRLGRVRRQFLCTFCGINREGLIRPCVPPCRTPCRRVQPSTLVVHTNSKRKRNTAKRSQDVIILLLDEKQKHPSPLTAPSNVSFSTLFQRVLSNDTFTLRA